MHCAKLYQALSNATQQEGLKSNRMVVFATIFANQVAFEMNQRLATESKQPLGPAAELPKHIAYRTMKAAFENVAKSPENPIQVSDVRDLRFMAQIFERQGKHEELFKLWDEAPATLKTILEVNHDDMLLLKNDILRKVRWLRYILKHTVMHPDSCRKEMKDNCKHPYFEAILKNRLVEKLMLINISTL